MHAENQRIWCRQEEERTWTRRGRGRNREIFRQQEGEEVQEVQEMSAAWFFSRLLWSYASEKLFAKCSNSQIPGLMDTVEPFWAYRALTRQCNHIWIKSSGSIVLVYYLRCQLTCFAALLFGSANSCRHSGLSFDWIEIHMSKVFWNPGFKSWLGRNTMHFQKFIPSCLIKLLNNLKVWWKLIKVGERE